MKSIEQGLFREDLYYRIGVIAIELPPLRERGDDILLLANVFLRRFSEEFGKKSRGFSRAALTWLNDYSWPGNVRELENKIKRAVVMAETAFIEPWDLGFVSLPQMIAEEEETESPNVLGGELNLEGLTLKEARLRVEYDLLTYALENAQGNVQQAAEKISVSRPTMYDLLKKHGLHH
jgi:two-component system NtrC family response regulator